MIKSSYQFSKIPMFSAHFASEKQKKLIKDLRNFSSKHILRCCQSVFTLRYDVCTSLTKKNDKFFFILLVGNLSEVEECSHLTFVYI